MDKIRLLISHGKSRYDISLNSKITRIIGNSATGKTSLADAFSSSNRSLTDYKIIGIKGYNITSDITFGSNTLAENFRKLKNHIVIIDEKHYSAMQEHEVEQTIQENKSCYFIILGRGRYAGLNIDIDSVYEFKNVNGINRLSGVAIGNTSVSEHTKFDYCILEDTGKAYTWFESLFNRALNLVPASSGKETVCKTAAKILEESCNSNVLLLFDRVSFGACYTEYIELLKDYGSRLFIVKDYKSWEYLMLKTNMFKSRFIEYSIQTGLFEEKYYEQLLQKVSSSRLGTIKHDGGKLPLCYTEPCCPYTSNTDRECTFGIATGAEKDKFVDLLRGTEFEDLLKISGRL